MISVTALWKVMNFRFILTQTRSASFRTRLSDRLTAAPSKYQGNIHYVWKTKPWNTSKYKFSPLLTHYKHARQNKLGDAAVWDCWANFPVSSAGCSSVWNHKRALINNTFNHQHTKLHSDSLLDEYRAMQNLWPQLCIGGLKCTQTAHLKRRGVCRVLKLRKLESFEWASSQTDTYCEL